MLRSHLFLALALCSITGTSHADDAKVIPGSACSFQNIVPTASSFFGSRITNRTTVSQSITCPIVRDFTQQGVESLSAQISTPAGTSASCRLRTISFANAVTSVTNDGQSNLGGTLQSLEWFFGAPVRTVPEDAALSIECTLPPNAFLYSYEVTENE